MNSFSELGISQNLLQLITEKGFERPTKIQAKAIPLIIDGKDVIGKSHTGSGKTFAFSAGMIDHLPRGKGPSALILTPTRELAQQVSDSIKDFAQKNPLKITAVYGGVSYDPQERAMEKADIIVATPGRLYDHIERGTVDLSRIEVLVLDEADRMLDMGFIKDVCRIVDTLPEERQTLLFSATMTSDLKYFCDKYMYEPVTINVSNHVDPSKLKQVFYDCPDNKKVPLLVNLLFDEHSGLTIVFCNTRHGVDFVTKNLEANDLPAVAIHGGFTQNKRLKALEHFQSEKKKVTVLVCTDVAARGLDIQGVSHVYNFDLPDDAKEYVHRIGRTARAGKDGKVINLLTRRHYDNFSRILEEYPKITVDELDIPELEHVVMRSPQRRRGGPSHRGGRGPSRGGSRGGQQRQSRQGPRRQRASARR